MKNFIATLALTSVLIAGSAFAQNGGVLVLQGAGGTFTAPLDPQGGATILGVKPGNYQVALLVPAIQKVREAANRSTAGNDKHKGEIEINSWSWGASYIGSANGGVWKTTNGNQASGREASTPSVSEIVVTKQQDAASPQLSLKASPAVHAQLDRKTTHNGQEYYTIKLTDILVSGIQSSGGGATSGSDRPTESVSLNFTKITYRVQ